ncbi:hypothetical protein KP509_18G048200 [Ceratopteris richardii]|uniref:BED-type domain-containing protein n=1 Tax=Ceratopteris richardii TaxID=49495 RepID=A0A8T2SU04_CERRI|nr:hypothetical protein KP509_18G048200 [Ceratopteris richardii]
MEERQSQMMVDLVAAIKMAMTPPPSMYHILHPPTNPYWRYVKKIEDYSGGGGSRKWKCNFCGYEKTGFLIRVKDHLARIACRDTGSCKEDPNDVC